MDSILHETIIGISNRLSKMIGRLCLDIMNREPFNDETSHPPSGGEAVARNAGAAGVRGRDSCGH